MTHTIEKTALSILESACDVASMLGIEGMILDSHSVRGRHPEAGAIFVLPFEPNTEWEFNSMGITRVSELSKRLSLIKSRSDAYVGETTVKTRGDLTYAHVITLKHGKSKVEFKCGDPSLMKIPKGLTDEHMFAFQLKRGDIGFIKTSVSAMKAIQLVFTNVKNTDDVEISIPTKGKDEVASNVLDNPIINLTDESGFSHKYDANILLKAIVSVEKLLKKDSIDEIEIIITRRGVLHMLVHGMSVYILPSPV